MPDQDYYTVDRISHSKLKDIRKSPAYFRYRLSRPIEETEPMLLGTLIHAMVLEPDTVSDRFILMDEKIDRRTKAGKEAWAALQEGSGEKRVINQQMTDTARRVCDSVMSDAHASMLVNDCIESGSVEEEFYFDWDGVECKSKLDGVTSDGEVVDLKTTRDADPELFCLEIYKRYYHTQAAFYRTAIRKARRSWKRHTFVVVEVEPPYGISIISVSPEGVQIGEDTCRAWLGKYKQCVERGSWPGYGIHVAEPPRWLGRKAD